MQKSASLKFTRIYYTFVNRDVYDAGHMGDPVAFKGDTSLRVILVSGTVVTNRLQLRGLKQQEFILPQIWRPKSLIKVSARPLSLQVPREGFFPASSGF